MCENERFSPAPANRTCGTRSDHETKQAVTKHNSRAGVEMRIYLLMCFVGALASLLQQASAAADEEEEQS